MLEIIKLILGPVYTNTYLVADTKSGEAVVIDPADKEERIITEVEKRSWRLIAVWLTHAHFDHLGGVSSLTDRISPTPPIALHPDDLPLWRMQGGAQYFGLQLDPGPEPTILLRHGQWMKLGEFNFEVRHAPGHTPGHVIFYNSQSQVVFCGDVIFKEGIGRTDFPGGDFDTLINSIRSQILTLPDETRLLSGHGPETTVGWERLNNPFL
jgi:hydroxyacylglutathione hydrolase